MKKYVLFLLYLLSQHTFASYVNSCELEVQLLENSSIRTKYINQDGLGEIEEMDLSIKGIVKKAKPSGRADDGCQSYLGQILQEYAIKPLSRFEIKKGQTIRLNIVVEDSPLNTSTFRTITYLGIVPQVNRHKQ